jgi:uncharacterized protein (TIGR02284 family)
LYVWQVGKPAKADNGKPITLTSNCATKNEELSMDNNDVISTLNSLIKTSKDGEEGFSLSAENVSDPELKRIFRDRAERCAIGARELQEQVQRLGGDPSDSGSASGALHRAWTNVKGSVTGRDDKAILNEVERGEDVAVESYEKALKENLPADIRALVERQYQGVKQNHDRVKQLRDSYANR